MQGGGVNRKQAKVVHSNCCSAAHMGRRRLPVSSLRAYRSPALAARGSKKKEKKLGAGGDACQHSQLRRARAREGAPLWSARNDSNFYLFKFLIDLDPSINLRETMFYNFFNNPLWRSAIFNLLLIPCISRAK